MPPTNFHWKSFDPWPFQTGPVIGHTNRIIAVQSLASIAAISFLGHFFNKLLPKFTSVLQHIAILLQVLLQHYLRVPVTFVSPLYCLSNYQPQPWHKLLNAVR